jgi:hypothetical protein
MFDSKLSSLVSLKTVKGVPYQPGVIHPYRSSIMFVLHQDKNIIWGISDKYEIRILDSNAKVIKKIYKEYNPVEISEDYKKRVKERYRKAGRKVKIHFSKHFPAFRGLSVDDEGRLFVLTYERFGYKDPYFYFDVFDYKGKYIAKVPIRRADRFMWKNNKLYTVEVDEEGYPMANRYKVTWRY